MTSKPALVRRLHVTDAVLIGLGSMMGAGVFAAFTPAAQAAGNGLLIGLVVAAIVAFCNATSSAQLAAEYPTSGGTYVYGRERLGHTWGFLAGWSFIIGKIASCAAMALTFAAYVAPAGWERPVAVAAVVVLAGVNLLGITRTALVTRVLAVFVLAVLVVVITAGVTTGEPAHAVTDGLVAQGWYGILQSGGLLFFAFAGYARVATMGEEVVNPSRTIPVAITIALAIVVIVYAAIAITVLTVLGADAVAANPAPLGAVVEASAIGWAHPLVRVGAAAASLGALLALIAGIGRTILAMARERDLPSWLSAVHSRFSVPHRAEIAVAVIVCSLVTTVDLRGAIGFSSFGVLLYYFIANAAALTQSRAARRYPKFIAVTGAIGCLVLVVTLPIVSILVGLVVVALGLAYRTIAKRSITP